MNKIRYGANPTNAHVRQLVEKWEPILVEVSQMPVVIESLPLAIKELPEKIKISWEIEDGK